MRRVFAAVLVALYAASALGIEVVARVIPVVGSTPGNFGSFFRTGLQLRNGGGSDLTGRFVFHPSGRAAQASDPSLAFSLESDETVSWSDVVDAMGITGLGTLDMMLPPASSSPVVVSRVFNDAGAAGTSGFTEEAVDPTARGAGSPVLTGGTIGILVAPADLTHFRFNIGVRTLSSGVGFTMWLRRASGATVHGELRSYDPNFFEQVSAQEFLGVPLEADDSIEITVERGSVIIYGATTDNTTNDSSLQYARVVPRTN
jgi:hypothetical protein